MARAYSSYQPQDYEAEPAGEWQSLRGELVALLDQVESQVARSRRDDHGYQDISERMRDLRQQMAEAEPDMRHREALRTVKRAVDRFNDRDEGYPQAPYNNVRAESYPAANPRDTLQAAIQEIRSRRAELSGGRMAETARPPASPRFDDLAQAVAAISGRLERLEAELRSASKVQTGNVKEIAEQVAQLSHVVELLAGAVGETGQVKRLEAQIAGLARLIAEGPQANLSVLTSRVDEMSATMSKLIEQQQKAEIPQRLDDVTATVGRLADLQVQYANRLDNGGMGEHLGAIEDGVRSIYDRIDAIEKHTALSPADIEKLTDELARVTEALKNPNGELMARVETLSARVGAIETTSGEIGGLKADTAALRAAVVDAMEPRFAALEMQIEALSDRVGDTSGDITVGQLEAQVRQLVARMDQTGEQLTGLARLYSNPSEREPDYEALAEAVAARTSEALTQSRLPAGASADIDEIEKRVSRLFSEARAEKPNDDLIGIESSIREVNERLARLEKSLSAQAAADDGVAAGTKSPSASLDMPPAPPAPKPEPAPQPAAPERRPPRSDAMPANPAIDAPLRDKPFGDDPRALNLLRKEGPAFDPASVPLPPRPSSSFDTATPRAFEQPAPAPAAEPPAAAEPAPSANTFIAAARRAAQRQQQASKNAGSNSLIARAFSNLQQSKPAASTPAEPAAPTAEKDGKKGKKGALAALISRRKAPSAAADEATLDPAPRAEAADDAAAPRAISLDQEAPDWLPREEPKESFLSRHRRPILLAASLVAIAFLTLNLINQRLSQPGDAMTEPPPADVGDASAILTTPSPVSSAQFASVPPPAAKPRVIPIVDSLATASIDPAAAKSFTPTAEIPAMPAAFVPAKPTSDEMASPAAAAATAALAAPAQVPEVPASPAKLEMPPEGIGPEALRAAAANGDARAQFEVAAIFTEGRAVPEDLAAAAIWYERAAAQGFAPAQYRLGNLYENGRGVEQDLEQARLWYQRAAEAGNRMAMHNLAALYAGGQLGKQEFDAAAEWFEQAALRGMRDSQFNLGMLYARGLGVEQSLAESYRWFSLAAKHGDADAAKARDDIARSLDAETIKKLTDDLAAYTPTSIDIAANFAPIGTWSETFDPGEAISNIEVVKNVQAALTALGYDVGTPDGLAGPKTADAIRAFERATGMSESGAVNPRLLAVLGSQPV